MPRKTSFIKLDRNIKDWSCFSDANTLQLWIFLLTSALYEPAEYRGVMLLRGQWATSFRQISKAIGQHHSTLKASMDRLIRCGAVTIESRHKKYMVITVNNYDYYQRDDKNRKQNKSKEEEDAPGEKPIIWDEEGRKWIYDDP